MTAKVVSVMLPPMVIFFPLFTFLEEWGLLPRFAYHADPAFCVCGACGKQALTMCMGLGCNAVGVTGCRIISQDRERKLAILTNCFMPCNGRFPLILAMGAALFVTGSAAVSALTAAGILVFAVGITLLVCFLLSKTFMRGESSSFILELPPFRMPQIGKILTDSLLRRTLQVLLRAVIVAAPAGVIIWGLSNITSGGISWMSRLCMFLDPFARFFGLDGVILTAFILGFPAHETILPVMFAAYAAQGISPTAAFTPITVICVLIFTICHWPCGTTCLTIWRETRSIKLTLAAMAAPTALGLALCAAVRAIAYMW
jgi:ferrous iron transport protein B